VQTQAEGPQAPKGPEAYPAEPGQALGALSPTRSASSREPQQRRPWSKHQCPLSLEWQSRAALRPGC
jgi:hypothetical protein